MALLLPNLLPPGPLSPGAYRELDVLRLLESALPDSYRLFHSVEISSMHAERQHFGEMDIVVLAPSGHLAILEVKSGAVEISPDGLFKRYGRERKDIGRQSRAQLLALTDRLRRSGSRRSEVSHFLVLPDCRALGDSVAFPAQRIIDSQAMARLGAVLMEVLDHNALDAEEIERVSAWLSDRFMLAPDPAARAGATRAANRRMASGLATWVPRMQSPQRIYQIEATAGSGKTQLALKLLAAARLARHRACYVCFNRALADRVIELAPPQALVGTIHELAIEAHRRVVPEPDLRDPATFEAAFTTLQAQVQDNPADLDLLIVDEAQDFEPHWIDALIPRLKEDGRLYVMGDPDQAIYDKGGLHVADAVVVQCRDNFRSPRKVVEAIEVFGLTEEPLVACGVDEGSAPEIHVPASGDAGGIACVADVVQRMLALGHAPADIAVLSFGGRERSQILAQEEIAGLPLRKYTGHFDAAGNAVWTQGTLLADTLYRFKGLSAPIVIVCEIDFERVDPKVRRRLLVGMTRAQHALHLVMTPRAESALFAHVESRGR